MRYSRQKLINLGCALTIMVLFCFQQAYGLEDKWISIKHSDEPQSFMMGTDDSMYDFYTGVEVIPNPLGPVHEVTIEYGMDMWQTEVTVEEYREYVESVCPNKTEFPDDFESCENALINLEIETDGEGNPIYIKRKEVLAMPPLGPSAFYGTYHNGDGVFSGPTQAMMNDEDNNTDNKNVELHYDRVSGEFDPGYGYPMNFVTYMLGHVQNFRLTRAN